MWVYQYKNDSKKMTFSKLVGKVLGFLDPSYLKLG